MRCWASSDASWRAQGSINHQKIYQRPEWPYSTKDWSTFKFGVHSIELLCLRWNSLKFVGAPTPRDRVELPTRKFDFWSFLNLESSLRMVAKKNEWMANLFPDSHGLPSKLERHGRGWLRLGRWPLTTMRMVIDHICDEVVLSGVLEGQEPWSLVRDCRTKLGLFWTFP